MGIQIQNLNVTVTEQVDDLRERMRLRQGDRRATVDILEANKSANRDEIKRRCFGVKRIALKTFGRP